MDVRNIHELAQASGFAAEKMAKNGIFATARLYYDVYCLEPGQAQKVHSHAGSDKVYLVLHGRARVVVGKEERDLAPGDAVLCPAGVDHGVRNESGERASLLVVTTPPPWEFLLSTLNRPP
jgi:mannose-6-phosphate isomerase-like protein (cupin superfamily)